MFTRKDYLVEVGIFIFGIFLCIYTIWGWTYVNEVQYNYSDRHDFYSTYENAWQQVEKDFPEARDVIYYDCLDNYYMNDKNDYFVVVRKFTVYYNTKHVENYEYKLVMYDSDIIMSEYWEV